MTRITEARKKYGPTVALIVVLIALECGGFGLVIWDKPGEVKAVLLVCIFCVLGIVALIAGL